jgi:hypothetical protein
MKIVKFKKDHVAGFSKGDVTKIADTLADRLESEGYVKEGTEAEYDKFVEALKKKKPESTYESNKQAVNQNKSECEDCGEGTENCEECGNKSEPGVIKKYYPLTQEDIDANPKAAEGLNPGDEVEEDEDGDLVIGDDGKFIKLILGNE